MIRLFVGAALIVFGALAVTGLVLLHRSCETAAGADLSPADGAARTAGSSMPAAAPAPGAPVEGAGAPGVPLLAMALLTPDDPRLPADPVDAAVEDWALVLGGTAPVGGGAR